MRRTNETRMIRREGPDPARTEVLSPLGVDSGKEGKITFRDTSHIWLKVAKTHGEMVSNSFNIPRQVLHF
jgi:hypothetical protein